MQFRHFYQKNEFLHFLQTDTTLREHDTYERDLMARHQQVQSFMIDGYCKVCDQTATFTIDQQFGATFLPDGLWLPNWRERLTCTQCKLNNRQRAMLHAMRQTLACKTEQPLNLYAMEQVTPLFHWLKTQFHNKRIQCTGSEYVSAELPGGTLVNGVIPDIRHENVEALSFADQTFDLVVSNDVLEHVNDPERAITEILRVLKPGGDVFITIPFYLNAERTVRRARLTKNGFQHLLPPVYHGNPFSDGGSLVFNDFGWDFVALLVDCGFQDVALCNYWSRFYGYLGDPQYFFQARKPV